MWWSNRCFRFDPGAEQRSTVLVGPASRRYLGFYDGPFRRLTTTLTDSYEIQRELSAGGIDDRRQS